MLAAFLVCALAGISFAGIWIGSAVVARHRAQAAADLAALAAAHRVPAGRTTACGGAESLAAAMGASVTRCELDHLDVFLTVQVHTGTRLGGVAVATAKAGPALAARATGTGRG